MKNRTGEENEILRNLTEKMKDTFQFNEKLSSFVWMSSQNCSDLLIVTGLYSHNLHFNAFIG